MSLTELGIKTQGIILINGVRMFDLDTRKAKKVESVPSVIVDEVLARLLTILE